MAILKQIGLALHNYHTATNAFPLGASLAPNAPPNTGGVQLELLGRANALLLPYLEQSPIYSAINF